MESLAPCGRCGSNTCIVRVGPFEDHFSKIECSRCGVFLRWGPEQYSWQTVVDIGDGAQSEIQYIPANRLAYILEKKLAKEGDPVLHHFLETHKEEIMERRQKEYESGIPCLKKNNESASQDSQLSMDETRAENKRKRRE